MRVELRRLRGGELDHELIWLLVTVCAALSAIAWFALHLPRPTCTFRELTGLPCVTCGATRSFIAFLHGDLGMAWRLNPLIFAGFCGTALFDLYAVGVLSSGAPRVRFSFPKQKTRRIVMAGAGAVVALNWIYLLQQ